MGIYDKHVDPFALPTQRSDQPDSPISAPSQDKPVRPARVDGPAHTTDDHASTTAQDWAWRESDAVFTITSLGSEPADTAAQGEDGDLFFIRASSGGRRLREEFRGYFDARAIRGLEFQSGVDDLPYKESLAQYKAAKKVWDEASIEDRKVMDRPKAPTKPVDLSKIDDVVLMLCLRLRDRVQHNRDTVVSPNAKNQVRVSPDWITSARLMLDVDAVDPEQMVEVIEWATENSFWRTNILSMTKLRDQYERLVLDDRFLRWREQTGRVAWSPEVTRLCTSMATTLDYLFPSEAPHAPNPLHARGAAGLLVRYSVLDVEDMMQWGVATPGASRMLSLLSAPWVADSIRRDPSFVAWSQALGREWARSVRLATAKPQRKSGRMLDTKGNDEATLAAAARAQ